MGKDQISLIAKFSTFFVKRSRVSFLILVGILALGFFSYDTFLKREGFPAVQPPIVFIQTPYFVGDKQKVNEHVTSPIEQAAANINEVKEVSSTTTENFSNIVVEFEENFSTKEGLRLVTDQINKNVTLPEGTKAEFRTFNAGSIDGKHDLIFTISDNRSTEELQEAAQKIALELEEDPRIAESNVIEPMTKETNPLTGEEFDYKSGFNRVGVRKNGTVEFSNAVAIGVLKKGDLGTLELSKIVRNKVGKLNKQGQLKGLEVNYGGDFADSLNRQINSLEENALSGLIIVALIIFLFIGWRASAVIAIFIPLVSAATFLVLYLLGYTLNVIVLFSLILVLGLVVDDAIVVVEAIDFQKKQGKKGLEAIKAAISNIGIADIAGTLTTTLVFIPMIFVSGLLGDFIRLIPITIISAYTASILLALTITPFLSNILIADKKKNPYKLGLEKVVDIIGNYLLYGISKLVDKFADWASKFIQLYLRKWPLAILIFLTTIIWIVVGISFSQKLTFAVFPPAKDSNQISVFLTFPPQTNIQNAEEIAKEAEKIITATAKANIKIVNYYEANENGAYLNLELTPFDSRQITSKEIVEKLQSSFEDFGETSVRVEQAGVGPPIDEFQINLQIFNNEEDTLSNAANDIKSSLEGKEVREKDFLVNVNEVKIDNVGTIAKKDGRRFALVKVKISDPNNTAAIISLQEQIKKEYNKKKLSALGLEEDSLDFDLGQEGENIESFESTIVASGFALIFMYILLVLVYDSLLQPLLIFTAIPFAFPGLFPGLYLTNNSIGFFVMLGIIALSGIVVNNTIMLVDYANRAKKEGLDSIDSISSAIKERFRPIITTSFTSVIAMLPLTLSEPFWESLGLTLIFGLISSSLLVILAFPVFYAIVEVIRETRNKVWRSVTRE